MRPFSLLVKPASADCNLRCKYCFYLDRCELYPERERHRMSDEVLERMISSFMATDQAQYSIGWQGGEPTLMGVDFFRKVTAMQQKFGRRGASVANGLQTNGTVINTALAKHLAAYHFLVGVSVDGPARIHDSNRLTVGGGGSHAAVMRGLDLLKKHGVAYNILTLVNKQNVSRPAETYRYLCDMGILFHQYIECVEFDAGGQLLPFAINGEAWGAFLCRIFDEWYPNDTRRVSVRLFDTILSMLVDGVPNSCNRGTDCRAYLVVEHNGDIYPCDFFVREDLKLGNIMTDSWETLLASPLYETFGRRKREWHHACATCRWLSLCAGDCPKNRMPGGGSSRSISVLCEGWKLFFEHTIARFEKLASMIQAERASQRRERSGGPRRPHPQARAGRNDPCPCGSGKKYKKCCGSRR